MFDIFSSSTPPRHPRQFLDSSEFFRRHHLKQETLKTPPPLTQRLDWTVKAQERERERERARARESTKTSKRKWIIKQTLSKETLLMISKTKNYYGNNMHYDMTDSRYCYQNPKSGLDSSFSLIRSNIIWVHGSDQT